MSHPYKEWAEALISSDKSPARKRARFAILAEPVVPYPDTWATVRLALDDAHLDDSTIMRVMGACKRIVDGDLDGLPTEFPDLLKTVWTGKGWTIEATKPVGQVLVDGVQSVRLGLPPRRCDQCNGLFAPQRKDNVHCSPACRVNAASRKARS